MHIIDIISNVSPEQADILSIAINNSNEFADCPHENADSDVFPRPSEFDAEYPYSPGFLDNINGSY